MVQPFIFEQWTNIYLINLIFKLIQLLKFKDINITFLSTLNNQFAKEKRTPSKFSIVMPSGPANKLSLNKWTAKYHQRKEKTTSNSCFGKENPHRSLASGSSWKEFKVLFKRDNIKNIYTFYKKIPYIYVYFQT